MATWISSFNLYSPAALRLVLSVEGCAAVLQAGIAAEPAGRQLAHPLGTALANATLIETMRFLRARGQLRQIVDLATERGYRVIVLKGGLEVARRAPPIAMADIDLLLKRDSALDLWGQLQRRGYRAEGPGSARHLATLRSLRGGELSVDLHVGLDIEGETLSDQVWSTAVPVEEMPDLYALNPGDHLQHLLVHTVVDHVERRSRLRDLILVSRALKNVSPDQRKMVDAVVHVHRATSALQAFLEQADAIARGEYPADPFDEIALAVYQLARSPHRRWMHHRVYDIRSKWIMAFMTSLRTESRVIWTSLLRPSLNAPTLPVARHLARHSPTLATAIRVAVRLAGRLVALMSAIPIVIAVRRQYPRLTAKIHSAFPLRPRDVSP